MSSHTHHAETNREPHSVSRYFQIWATILVLFVVSITVAQISDNRILVLITAFGIALIQAFLVTAYFMHLSEEKPLVWYMLLSMVLALGMLYFGTLADVGHPHGANWVATDTTRIMKEHEEHKPEGNATEHAKPPAAHATP